MTTKHTPNFWNNQGSIESIIGNKELQSIVRAVNCHDELVEALQLVMDTNYRNDNTEHNEVFIPLSTLKIIEQALKKAGA